MTLDNLKIYQMINYILVFYHILFFLYLENYDDIKSNILNNSIIISHYEINDLKLIKKIKIPKFYRYTSTDTFFKFYPDYIVLYEKN